MSKQPRSPLGRARSRVRSGLRRLSSSAQNARELVAFGRLGEPWGSPYEVVHRGRSHRLRRYASDPAVPRRREAGPVLLVPPLMVTAEVYDVAADISAVAALLAAGLDVWLVDFGAPEREAGGLERTLDDHVLAVDHALTLILETCGRSVHLIGYSQGGMFCYQAAAFRRCEGVASLVTFGSPVDIHRNLPAVDADLGARMIGAASRVVSQPLARLDALPGFLTSTGFKLLSLRKELQQISEFMAKLHDRDALIKRESRRRFLAGEGFVAWPGPALRTFIDDFIVNNRMSAGGFVIAGRTVSLADLDVPILYFVGERDDIARAASVRGIIEAAPLAEAHGVAVPAGHFGLVVGSTAMQKSWPTVVEWVAWRDLGGPRPELLPDLEAERRGYDEVEALEVDAAFELGDVVGSLIGGFVELLGQGSHELGETFDNLRYQVPRLRTLEQLGPATLISLGRELSDRAARHPDRTFFLWRSRAFSYAEADRRVDAIVRGLIDRGIEPGRRVGVLMGGRPSHLSVVAALNRLGAIAVLFEPGDRFGLEEPSGGWPRRKIASRRLELLAEALANANLVALIVDPPNAALAVASAGDQIPVLVLGGGPRHGPAMLPDGVFDLETVDPSTVALPDWYVPNPGRARDLALVIVTLRAWASPRQAAISNGRWAMSAYGAAATCLLSSKDTVYCVLPLHHPAGIVAVGGALVGRSRLALAEGFDPEQFWLEVRRYGATVCFYAGEMCRALISPRPGNAQSAATAGNHSLRLFAGSGMRADLWRELDERFGPIAVREFYASTEGNLVLANISGKRGALGRPLPGADAIELVAYDFDQGGLFVRDALDHARRCRTGEAGLLIAKLGPTHPAGIDSAKVHRDVFAPRDAWYATGDILRRDADGDYWYVDRASRLIRGPHGWISPREIEDALYGITGIEYAVVYGLARTSLSDPLAERLPAGGPEAVVATLVVRDPQRFDLRLVATRVAELRPEQRPGYLRLRSNQPGMGPGVNEVPLTDGFRPLEAPLIAAGVDSEDPHLWIWEPASSSYQRWRDYSDR